MLVITSPCGRRITARDYDLSSQFAGMTFPRVEASPSFEADPVRLMQMLTANEEDFDRCFDRMMVEQTGKVWCAQFDRGVHTFVELRKDAVAEPIPDATP